MGSSLNEESTISSTSSEIVMRLTGLCNIRNVRSAQRNKIKEKLKLKNPTYEQAIRTNPRARFAISQWIKYYQEEDDQTLTIPLGCWRQAKEFLEKSGFKVALVDERVSQTIDSGISQIRLRDYQSGVPNSCHKSTEGIFRLDTGFGKTIIALKIHEILQQKTLYVVPRLDLLDNVVKEYETYFKKTPGIIQGKNHSVKDFTVATVQSLQKRIREGKLSREEFGLVIVDECHLFVPSKWRGCVQFFSPRHLYGFTGTCDRSDGQGEAIKWFFGDIVDDRTLPGLVPRVRVATYSGALPTFRYDETVGFQVKDKRRNAFITSLLQESVERGRKVICLTKRVDHYQLLKDLLAERMGLSGLVVCNSDDKREDRKDKMNSLKDGSMDFKVVFGSLGLLAVGIDIPKIDTVIFAGDLKSSVLTRQAAGRCLRLFIGKKHPEIIDIYDTGNPIFRRQGKFRQAFYKKLGWSIDFL